jgi:hypothetical protein
LFFYQAAAKKVLPVPSAVGGGAAAFPNSSHRMAKSEPGYAMLYHQTNRAAADSILRSQSFRPGKEGFAGAGIYFCMNPEDTHGKAHEHGVVLEAKVLIGQSENISVSNPSMTREYLKSMKKDSVIILGMRTGVECVIYDHSQIKDIREFKETQRRSVP